MRDAVRAEWGKTWSLRSAPLCLVGGLVLVCGTAWTLANDFLLSSAAQEPGAPTSFAPVEAVAPALQVGFLLIAAFVMVAITSEYTSGGIRSTLTAEPRRGRVLLAKTLVSAVVAALAAALTVGVADAAVRATLSDQAAAGPSSVDTVLRAALVVLVQSVLVIGAATIVRHAVGALSVSFVLCVATAVLSPGIAVWTPAGASSAFLTGDPSHYPPVIGLAVTACWAVAAATAGWLVLRRRDA